METQELIKQAKEIAERIQRYSSGVGGNAAKAQVCEFLATYAGPRSHFAKQAQELHGIDRYVVLGLTGILESYVEYLEAGLSAGRSPERQAQLDVVSDVLSQAQTMLGTRGFHPAGSAVLIGAALEEFLRTWVEAEGLSLGNLKPSIDAYAKTLRGADLISKQDVKDITSWAGIRNDAAHGEWEKVQDPRRVELMLQGVNLFLREKSV